MAKRGRKPGAGRKGTEGAAQAKPAQDAPAIAAQPGGAQDVPATASRANEAQPTPRRTARARRAQDTPPLGDYRHAATRKNNPPAKIAAEGTVPVIPKVQYTYNPHLPPVLRFQGGSGSLPENHGLAGRATILPDDLPPLIAEAGRRPLTPMEQKLLAEALRVHEPWLEWTGKREKKWFEVDPVALHIHERISTQAILKVAARQDVQRSLFADPEQDYREAVQFYRHDVDWANRLILGDSLQVMSSLARREDLAGKVQMIYMDPPYGIKFASNFQPEVGRRDVKDKEQDLTREPEMVKAYRDTWHLGIHSYLSYLRDRLIVARELLADTGSIFVQISDENLHRIRSLLDETFGPENFCSVITFRKKMMPLGSDVTEAVSDYLIWYARDRERMKSRPLYRHKETTGDSQWGGVESQCGERRRLIAEEIDGERTLPDGARVFQAISLLPAQYRPKQDFPVDYAGRTWQPPKRSCWKTDRMDRVVCAERVYPSGETLRYVLFHEDYPVARVTNLWAETTAASDLQYVVQTNVKIIERCMLMTTDPGDLVLDPTCGSGTTAYVAEQWGRRWITVDTSRVAIAIARQRLLTAKYDYYRLRGTAFQAVKSDQDAPATHGSGFQPPSHGQDARATFEPVAFDPRQVSIRYSAYLPHWEQEGATYAVTFRLADSLPQEVLEGWLNERKEIERRAAAAHRPLSEAERRRLHELHSERVERYLDADHGACVLREARVACIVRDALFHFDGERYDLIAWCVMPNHVHVVVRPRANHELSKIVHSWKSYSSNEVNRILGRSGALWQPDAFDHLIRGAADLEKSIAYVLENPRAAGLHDWSWVGCGTAFGRSTAFQAVNPEQNAPATRGSGFQPPSHRRPQSHGQDARATSPSGGFIYKTVPHITLKSIAQNVALDPIFARHEPVLNQALEACNAALATVTPEIRTRLSAKLVRKEREEGKRAVTDADRRRWELPPGNRDLKAKLTVDAAFAGWYHWEVPFDTDPDWPAALRDAVTAYRKAWRAKMDEISACIAASAEQEELVDQPEVVRGVTRVSGPFTVEAVQPPEMSLGDNLDPYTGNTAFQAVNSEQDALAARGSRCQPEIHGQDARATEEGLFDGEPAPLPEGFAPRTLRMVEPKTDLEVANITAYLEQMYRYLKADGVRFLNNKQARWTRFEPLFESGRADIFHAEGRWVAGDGEDPDPDGSNNVAAIFGPQYGPVTAKLVEQAIRAANRKGYEHLLIAGFSFDGAATGVLSEADEEGGVFHGLGGRRLHVHFSHVRPDINPGMNGLLKESPQPGAGQLFSVFGLPRVTVERVGATSVAVAGGEKRPAVSEHGSRSRGTDEYIVTMEGVDIYNPVDNSIASSGADKVAAWFLDGDYDGRTFCVTQAFFPDRSAWEKLARALNGKDGPIDAERFEAFSGTTSLPFPAGQHRCVAVKVIDPRGNEVMCVQRLESRS